MKKDTNSFHGNSVNNYGITVNVLRIRIMWQVFHGFP